ncbi:Protein LURP-one-related like [Quillaja saponaria]|uniref:Protein LURP-one-related like n=1 Tax=Quillaja saponaria TaxID=32244 RepID=A0AAD7PD29_QUISA|nr:Protein LURP-one-related like [Quillaja saponaria]
MLRIHPVVTKHNPDMLSKPNIEVNDVPSPYVFTVWKRSSMSFQGTDGFTVFDHHGKLVFRVDNYSRKNSSSTREGLILMDGPGNALLTLKPQVLSMKCQWNAYRGDGCRCSESGTKFDQVFTMRSGSTLFHGRKDEAEIFMGDHNVNKSPDFRIEGWFRRRNCKIRDGNGEVVADISRKRVNKKVMLADDVFNLVVQPCLETDLIMAFVIILDRICVKSFTPILCS